MAKNKRPNFGKVFWEKLYWKTENIESQTDSEGL